MGTLFTAYHRCCECDEQATVMRSSGDGGPSTVAVWYCAEHSPFKLPLYSIESDVEIWRVRCEEAQAMHDEMANKVRDLMADLAAAQSRIELLESDMKTGDYETLYAQAVQELAAAQSYATTLAVSMHKQHYAEAAPNWQPLPDLVGLLKQIDNMYAGLRADLAAANTRADAMLRVAEKHEAEAAALLKACRKAVLALAHASTENPLYNEDYEALSAAIEAAKESGNG